MNYNLGLNITTLGLAIFVMFTLYLMATIMVSVYVNLTPKDFARMSIIVYMLGFLTLAIVVANIVWILFSLVILMFFVVWSLYKLKGKRTKKRQNMANAGGLNNGGS